MRKVKIWRKALAGILALTLVSGGTIIVPFMTSFDNSHSLTAYAEGTISIDKKCLKVNEPLKITNDSNYTLRYFVDGTDVTTDDFSLKPEWYEKWITVNAYTDPDPAFDAEPIATDKVYFSKLPVLYINTDDGQAITSKEEYKTGILNVQSNEDVKKTVYSGAIEIKGRGNSSWGWPKKPYRIKLNKKTDLFGMGENKNWVLIANYLDECYLRNKTAYDLSKELGLENMECMWTDVVLNGEYVGNYLLCEQIRIDKTRVNIFDWESEAEDVADEIVKTATEGGQSFNKSQKSALKDQMKSNFSWVTSGEVEFEGITYSTGRVYDESDISGGYLFEISSEYDEVSKFKTNTGLRVMIKSPEFLNTNSEMITYVEEFWNNFEKAYRSENGYVTLLDGSSKHYAELADIDSMVSYWLVMEIMGNNDSVWRSRYAYLDKGTKLIFGPVWDFDWGCASNRISTTATEWIVSKRNCTPSDDKKDQAFYKEFLDDPLFIAKATEKYWEIRPYLEELIKTNGILEDQISYLRESGAADNAIWDRTVTWDNARGFENDADIFMTYLRDRIAWLDEQFATDDSLLASTKTDLSSYPYEKSSDVLTIETSGASADTISAKAPADSMISNGSDLAVNVGVADAATKSVEVYVNGLYYESVDVENSAVSFTVPSSRLDAAVGKKNVVSLIGKNASGETTYKNFTTVITTEPTFETQNLVLSGQIGVNFFLDLSVLSDEEKANSYMEFTVNGKTTTDSFDSGYKNQTGDYYGFTCNVSSVQMADEITAVFHYGDATISKTYSVLDYINTIEDNAGAYDDTTLALINSIADYGHYAQPFLAANNNWTIGTDHAEMDKFYTSKYSDADDSYTSIKNEVAAFERVSAPVESDIDDITFSLSLNAETLLNVFVTPKEGYAGNLTISVDGLAEDEYTVEFTGSRYKVVIPNISAHKLGQTYTVRIVTENGISIYNVSALSYVYAVLNSESFDSVAKDAVASIYKYYEATINYRAAHNQ